MRGGNVGTFRRYPAWPVFSPGGQVDTCSAAGARHHPGTLLFVSLAAFTDSTRSTQLLEHTGTAPFAPALLSAAFDASSQTSLLTLRTPASRPHFRPSAARLPRPTAPSRPAYTQLRIPMKTSPRISLPFLALTTHAARATTLYRTHRRPPHFSNRRPALAPSIDIQPLHSLRVPSFPPATVRAHGTHPCSCTPYSRASQPSA